MVEAENELQYHTAYPNWDCPHTELKGSPEYAPWNVLYHTSFRNYASFSLQVSSIPSILLGAPFGLMATLYFLVEGLHSLLFSVLKEVIRPD
jgi:hypothetical protein